jgi:hypothetical protein
VIYGIPLDPDISLFLYTNSISGACFYHYISSFCSHLTVFWLPSENSCTLTRFLIFHLCFSTNLSEDMKKNGTNIKSGT